jgi:8-amino-3,8-dideoxy-alpha-D-manno-octulosonate transaminase
MGTNYRISELNAAVGLAQLGKLDRIVEIQKKNKATIKDAIKEIDGVTFRELPDPDGDSATFLSFFMPTQSQAEQAAKKLSENGAPCAYWYKNNWHYYKKWHHLKEMKRAAKLPFELSAGRPDYSGLALEQSEDIMKRALSMQIMLSWTDDDMDKRIKAILNALK